MVTPEVQAPQKKMVKALYDYKGKTTRELNIKKGGMLTLVNSSNKVSVKVPRLTIIAVHCGHYS